MPQKSESPKSKKRKSPSVLRRAEVPEWGRTVTVRDAKTHLSALLEWVASGHDLTITSGGKPKARLVRASDARTRKLFQGMGDYLSKQPIHRTLSADDAINADRDGHGW